MALLLQNILILHIPKTGSDWVRATCHAAVQTPLSEIGEWHSDLAEVLADPVCQQRRPLIATFIRHPLAWYRSAWVYWMQTGRFPRRETDPVVESPDFEVFIKNCLKVAPQGYVTELYSRFLEHAGRSVDFIGRQESLEGDLVRILCGAKEEFSEDIVRTSPPRNRRGSDPAYSFNGFSTELFRIVEECENSIVSNYYSDSYPT